MKKTPRKTQRSDMNLGDLVMLVSNCSRSQHEMVAAVADLLGSGRVRIQSNGRNFRAHLC